jgi:hypothetical protein
MNAWFARQTQQVSSVGLRDVLGNAFTHLSEFVIWPKQALLLWAGCDRKLRKGDSHLYHAYPEEIRERAKKHELVLDSRSNGPAIAAFELAGGKRPPRFGSLNKWTIHHIYSGKFPYVGKNDTTHATKECNHFTQSAGLVAIHPVADALADEFPFFAWLLRAASFAEFHYDPDGVFSEFQDEFGFETGYPGEILFANSQKNPS